MALPKDGAPEDWSKVTDVITPGNLRNLGYLESYSDLASHLGLLPTDHTRSCIALSRHARLGRMLREGG